MSRKTTIIPKAPLGRILMNHGAHRVSQDSLDAFCEILTEKAMEICTQAVKIAKHAGRVTVHAEDIELIVKI